MRLYGKKFMANRTDARIADRKESRDALVYDIDEVNRFCRVRVAGSDILVRAWFPNNFMRSPQWLKVNTAVRVAHVGGDKSRIEVVSPGLVQPSQVMSPMQGGVNAVLLGIIPAASLESTEGWTVRYSSGTYRINGVSYSFVPGGPGMDLSGWHMGDGGDMSGTYWMGTVDPIAAVVGYWFRYDAFVIGSDGVVDYIKGVEYEWTGYPFLAMSGPVKPDIPSDHVLMRNYILINSGTTSITAANIGVEWTSPHPEYLTIDYGYATPAYSPGGTRLTPGVGVVFGGPDIYDPVVPEDPRRGASAQDMQASCLVTVMDQYDNPYSWWTSGEINELEFTWLGVASSDGYGSASVGAIGGGAIPEVSDESGTGEPFLVSLTLGSSVTVNYTRLSELHSQSDPDLNGYPSYYQAAANSTTAVIKVTLIGPDVIHAVHNIITFKCLNAAGQVI